VIKNTLQYIFEQQPEAINGRWPPGLLCLLINYYDVKKKDVKLLMVAKGEAKEHTVITKYIRSSPPLPVSMSPPETDS
jgi:hypothetical protein